MSALLQEPKKDRVSAPSTWRLARVGEILKIRNGYAFKSTDYKQEGTALIRQSELRTDVVDLSDVKRVDPKFLKELPGFVIRKGDLLIGMSGSLGKIAEYQEDEPALQNQRTGLLVIKEGYDSKFAKLVLKLVEPQIVAEGKGVAVQNVSAKEIEDCKFPLPSLDEQRAIVAEIEKQFTRLEAGVGALKRVQANLKRYRAAVLKAACEGKLVPTEAELAKADSRTYETGEQLLQRILTERRKNWTGRGKYKEPVAPDTTKLPELPEGWVWTTFDHVVERMKNGTTTDQNRDGIGIPVSRIETIWDSKIDWKRVRHISSPSEELLEEYKLKGGDLLFSHINSDTHLGKTALYTDSMDPLLHGMNLMLLRPEKNVIAPSYLHFLCMHFRANGTFVRIAQHAVNQSSINQTKLKMVLCLLPPLAEQKRIVQEVERRLSVIDGMESTVTANLQRATRLRQSILQKAFN